MNRSKTYLMPLLFDVLKADTKYVNLITDCYISDIEKRYNNCIILEHLTDYKSKEYLEYEALLIRNVLFLDMYCVKNKAYYIFQFPKEYSKEYYLYKEGSYSKYGSDAKKLIILFWRKLLPKQSTDILTRIEHVLTKNAILRKTLEQKLDVQIDPNAELGEMYNNVQETLNFKELLQTYDDRTEIFAR